ncbi:MAG TPA: type II toxin-antitoxin system prevent-host-death family antitoxin, partial [Myxococcota bacterium]|nr:type II toxin-antitoxin system prevent-host-death family antitoxin [Myxococcota bacterium]
QRAEQGKPVQLTRRGHPVAAIISIKDFQVVRKKGQFFDRLVAFYADNPDNPLVDQDLEHLRTNEPPRDFSWED